MTHNDASDWSKELSTEIIKEHKNILIDGTKPKLELIQELKGEGYEVEIRVMATHQLESVLGVEQRYTKDVAKDGFGRYVPPHIQEPIYNELPPSLDKVREQFPDIRMRIYNRDGEVQYDSTLAQDIERKPSLTLIEAREQSLLQELKLNELNQSYEASIQQGRNLPQVLAENPNVDNALIPKHIEERTKLNAQGYLEQAGAEVHQQYRVVQIQQQMIQRHIA